MKKSLFILPVAALAMAACSSDTVTNDAQRVQLANADKLTIVPAVQGSTTRATSVTTSTLTAFDVYIEGKFQKGEENAALWDNEVKTITKVGSSWNFPSTEQYWWADKSTAGKFTAMAPTGNISGTVKPTTTSVTVDDDIVSQVDYLVAYNEGVREDFSAGVPLNFQHVLSQIIVKAANISTSDIKVEVAGAKLVHAKKTNTLTLPTASTAKGTFSWDDYTPWNMKAADAEGNIYPDATGDATYSKFNSSESITQSGVTTLTGSATALFDPMLLMPQKLIAQDLTATSKSAMPNNYLAVLVRVSTKAKVGYRDADGHYYTGTSSDKTVIPFTARRTGSSSNDTYKEEELAKLAKGEMPAGWGSGYTNDDNAVQSVISAYDTETKIYTEEEVLYPREGFGTTSEKFAYVAVALDQEWKPGYKYTYTLNFSKDGIGKSIADQPADAADYNTAHPTYNFPYGNNYETGEADVPGEDIVDNPTLLFFTVTVDDWNDATAINKDM